MDTFAIIMAIFQILIIASIIITCLCIPWCSTKARKTDSPGGGTILNGSCFSFPTVAHYCLFSASLMFPISDGQLRTEFSAEVPGELDCLNHDRLISHPDQRHPQQQHETVFVWDGDSSSQWSNSTISLDEDRV